MGHTFKSVYCLIWDVYRVMVYNHNTRQKGTSDLIKVHPKFLENSEEEEERAYSSRKGKVFIEQFPFKLSL